MPSATAASVSTTKSRSPTASRELRGHARRSRAPRRSPRGRADTRRRPGHPSRAGSRSGTSARIGEAAAVALGHLDVGKQVVAEEHRLGGLGVGRAGQDGVALALGEADEGVLEGQERGVEAIVARRVQSRRSVATWSFRDRPVWSLPATGPSRGVRAASRLRWTSSSAGSHVEPRRPRRPPELAAGPRRASRPRPASAARPGPVRGRGRSSLEVVERELRVDDRSIARRRRPPRRCPSRTVRPRAASILRPGLSPPGP